MATLPDQIRRQAEAANRYYEPADKDQPEQTLPEGGTQDEDQPKAKDVTPEPQTLETDAAPAATETVTGEQPEEGTEPEDKKAPEDWEQRYRTAQGMLRAESQQWKLERQELRNELSELRLELARAKQAPQTPPLLPRVLSRTPT